jgi:hypothetical protein
MEITRITLADAYTKTTYHVPVKNAHCSIIGKEFIIKTG